MTTSQRKSTDGFFIRCDSCNIKQDTIIEDREIALAAFHMAGWRFGTGSKHATCPACREKVIRETRKQPRTPAQT